MGFAIGALVTGAVADWIGIPWSIFVTAMLTLLAVPHPHTDTNTQTYTHTQGMLVFFFYEEVAGDDSIGGREVAEIPQGPGLSLKESLKIYLLMFSPLYLQR